jgi:RNA polymerase sigma-70 factor (ECF subfamily)
MAQAPGSREDNDLAAALDLGDQSALEVLYQRHGGAALSLGTRILRNQAMAEEVVQEVFVRLWKEPRRFDPERGALRSFLLRDTHGRAVDLLRSEVARRNREERDGLLSSDTTPGPEQEVWEAVRSEKVRTALQALPEEERRAVVLAYFGGYSYREVAERLGAPEGTVKSRIRSGLKRLQGPLLAEGMA